MEAGGGIIVSDVHSTFESSFSDKEIEQESSDDAGEADAGSKCLVSLKICAGSSHYVVNLQYKEHDW
jgi:hypothetical protein